MVSEVVLDASAILAMLRDETGAATVRALIEGSSVSTVNAAEVISKLIDRGMSPDSAHETVGLLPFEWTTFDREQAISAGRMRARARSAGLSLGDRACLALAEARGLPVVTADRQWKAFQSTVEIKQLR